MECFRIEVAGSAARGRGAGGIRMKHNACLVAALGLAALFSGTRSVSAQVLNPAAYPSQGVLNVSGEGFAIDTDALTYNGVSGGVLVGGVAVFDFDSVSIASGATVTVTGSHPLALLSRGAFVQSQGATLSANAGGYGSGSGPGAGPGGSRLGFAPGGGGGFGGPGAAGAGNGGAAYGDLLVKLEGGSGGGGGADARDVTTHTNYAGGAGGAGGGAIEISAGGAITIAGVINARGNAGQAGQFGFNTHGSPGGGGAGGGILLAGASVTLAASSILTAAPGSSGGYPAYNGGGGGRIIIQTPHLADFVSSGVIDVANTTDYGFHDGVVSVNGAAGSVSGRVMLEGGNFAAQPITFNVRDASGAPLFDRILSVVDNGGPQNFTIYGIPVGTVQIRIKPAKNLAQTITATVSGAVFAGTVTLPGGDANNDNSVDSTDFGILIGAFNSAANVPGSGYDSTADFNSDGSVDSTDFGILINNFGREGAN